MRKKTSGIEKVPRILKKPFWTDRFFWTGMAMAVFWAGIFWWLLIK